MILDCYEKFNDVCLSMEGTKCVAVRGNWVSLMQLFESEKYEEAALHAATSPKVSIICFS